MLPLKKSLPSGLIAGVLWGWASMVVNAFTGVFAFEGGFLHDVVSFGAGGALLGLVCGGVLGFASGLLPFKWALAKAVFVCAAVWLLLKAGGTMLSSMEPDRYHIMGGEAVQGLFLSVLLGVLLWAFGGWREGSGDVGEERA